MPCRAARASHRLPIRINLWDCLRWVACVLSPNAPCRRIQRSKHGHADRWCEHSAELVLARGSALQCGVLGLCRRVHSAQVGVARCGHGQQPGHGRQFRWASPAPALVRACGSNAARVCEPVRQSHKLGALRGGSGAQPFAPNARFARSGCPASAPQNRREHPAAGAS